MFEALERLTVWQGLGVSLIVAVALVGLMLAVHFTRRWIRGLNSRPPLDFLL